MREAAPASGARADAAAGAAGGAPAPIEALLLDVEGTTTPVRFVYEVLFPFAREALEDFLRRHAEDQGVLRNLERLRREHRGDVERGLDPPRWERGCAAYARWLIDRDRKSGPLKSLQGRIWEEGYARGELRGRVYPDVPRALARWNGQGREVHVYSSGSVLAQRLLFRHALPGDLTGHIRGYFDTGVGPKKEPESYRQIAARLGRPPERLLFVSDSVDELDAAREAGLATALSVREGAAPPDGERYPVVRSFDALFPDQGGGTARPYLPGGP